VPAFAIANSLSGLDEFLTGYDLEIDFGASGPQALDALNVIVIKEGT